jgi:Tfp pilus assembly protein PilO
MITTYWASSMRACLILLAIVFIAMGIGVSVAQDREQKEGIRTSIALQGEKISSLEEWRKQLERTPERLATLESQLENQTWMMRALLAGIAALLGEMFVRLAKKN